MDTRFQILSLNGVSTLVYKPWHQEGIVHGMTLAELDFSAAHSASSLECLRKKRGLTRVLLAKQTHGDAIWRVSKDKLDDTEESDAVLLTYSECDDSDGIAIGVKTADCVPIIVQCRSSLGRSSWCCIHAGWRGLANGIIGKALTECQRSDEVVSAAIFAAAGRDKYEVGSEVISAIGSSVVAQRIPDSENLLLDVQGTAKEQILRALPDLDESSIGVSRVCTISNPSFHSYRRDGTASGRNLTFVKFSSKIK